MKTRFLHNARMLMTPMTTIAAIAMNLDFTCRWTKKHNSLNHCWILKGTEYYSFMAYNFGDLKF